MSNNNEKVRFLYIDNLRLLMIILVVLIHLAVTYSGQGSWYFMDNKESDMVTVIVLGTFQSFTQAYFMGFLFLISGYFTAKSYDHKGFSGFITGRLIRLGIPTLFYMLVIHPFIGYVVLGSTWERPSVWKAYCSYLLSFDFLGCSGPLWFAFALLIFDFNYAVYRMVTHNRIIPKEKELAGIGSIWVLIGLITIFAFLIRLVQPIGTSQMNMQLCFFSQYIILFIIGIKAGRYDWFSRISYRSGRKWVIAAFVPGIVFWGIILFAGGFFDNGFGAFGGGLRWQSAAYALWESFTCVAMSIGLIGVFREKHNKQNKFIKTLSDNSFAVYMFHAPIIIAVSLAIVKLQLYPILKFILASMIGLPLSFLLSHYIFRRIPLLKEVL